MPCLLTLLALLTPRFVILVLWLFSNWFKGIFTTALWPVLGFIFVPTTLLWYTVVQRWFHGQWTLWPVVGLVIALLIDVSPARHGRKKRS